MKKYALLFLTFALAISANESVFKLDKIDIPPTLLSGLTPNITIEHEDSVPKRIIDVQIPGCNHIKLEPYAYEKAAQHIWFNLEKPGTLNPKFKAYNGPTPPDTTKAYHREHIYEVQMIALFIASLQDTPALWNPTPTSTDNFCDWVKTNVIGGISGNAPLINDLRGCLPYNKQRGWMPWVEAWANGMKGNAISGKAIRDKATFQKYTPSVQVAHIRTVVGVLSYMSNVDVKQAFDDQSKCIKNAWLAWLDGYVRGASITFSSDDFSTLYDKWLDKLLTDANQILVNAFNDMIGWWEEKNQDEIVDVYVNFNSLISSGSTKYDAPAFTGILKELIKYK